MNSETGGQDPVLTILSGMLSELSAQTQALHSIAQSQQGLWECCLAGSSGNNLLLEISMVHYTLPPDARWKLYQERLAAQEGKPKEGVSCPE